MSLWKSFHLILMHFFNSSMLWGEVASNSVDFPKFIFFYNFDRSSLFFNQSKLHLKISVSLCLVRLIKPVFSINRTSWIKFFFLNTVFDSFKTLFQNFFKLSSLSDLARLHWEFLVIFNQILCKVFLFQGR